MQSIHFSSLFSFTLFNGQIIVYIFIDSCRIITAKHARIVSLLFSNPRKPVDSLTVKPDLMATGVRVRENQIKQTET